MNRWLSGNLAWPLTERLCGRDTWRRLRELRTTRSYSAQALRDLLRAGKAERAIFQRLLVDVDFVQGTQEC